MFSGCKRHTSEDFQLPHWPRSRRNAIMYVELHDFSSLSFAIICDVRRNAQNSRWADAGSIHMNVAVFESGVSQSIAERKQWLLAFELIAGVPTVWRTRSPSIFV